MAFSRHSHRQSNWGDSVRALYFMHLCNLLFFGPESSNAVQGSCQGSMESEFITSQAGSKQVQDSEDNFQCPASCFIESFIVCDKTSAMRSIRIKCSDGTLSPVFGFQSACDGVTGTTTSTNGFTGIDVRYGRDINGFFALNTAGGGQWFGCSDSNCQTLMQLRCLNSPDGQARIASALKVIRDTGYVHAIQMTCRVRRCPSGSYWLNHVCTACSVCGSGNYWASGTRCGLSFQGQCSSCDSCPAGQYRAGCGDVNAGSCTPCATCPAGKNLVGCTGVNAGACVGCEVGRSVACMGTCLNSCPCPAGNRYLITNSGGISYEGCMPCPVGTFSSGINSLTTCSSCQSCGVGLYRSGCGGISEGTCVGCQKDFYLKDSSTGTCASCAKVNGVSNCLPGKYASCPANSPGVTCLDCVGYTNPLCGIGFEPSINCDGGGLSNSICQACPASKEKKTNTVIWCTLCNTGFYKLPSGGASNCQPCTNAPTGGVYSDWTSATRDSNTCPWFCRAGYSRSASTCLRCNATAGKFSSGNDRTVCSDCTNARAAQAYYTLPTSFDGTRDACPWECNPGYYKSGSLCLACNPGTFKSVRPISESSGGDSTCSSCTTCQSQQYQSRECNITHDRICLTCGISCAPGQFIISHCSATANITCMGCSRRCPAGKFLSGTACSGTTKNDAVWDNCQDCLVPQNCTSGNYLSGQCLGNETKSNECIRCAEYDVVAAGCKEDQYYGGCEGFQNTRCLNISRCPAGQYRSGKTYKTPGTCRGCTNCSSLGLKSFRNCSFFSDTVCAGVRCGPNETCTSGFESKTYCDYGESNPYPFCGLCPQGYESDGQYCIECPEGKTCDRRGVVACEGQCPAWKTSDCDMELGYARCLKAQEACTNFTTDGTQAVTRAGYRLTNMAVECAPYFQCNAGHYKRNSISGSVHCEPCLGIVPPHAAWVTPGLSINDGSSCIWECSGGLSVPNANRTGCILLPGRGTQTFKNIPGWWSSNRSANAGTCGLGKTSELGGALGAAECVPCPSFPPGMDVVWVGSGVQCEWECKTGSKIGAGCAVQTWVGSLCKKVGLMQTRSSNGGCVSTSFPWNLPGYSKSGWIIQARASGGNTTTDTLGDRAQVLARVEANGVALLSASLPFGWRSRHRVEVTRVVGNISGTVRRWTVAGPLCSLAHSWIGGYEFVFGAVCNQSFLAYLNLSYGTNATLGVLIGNASTRGWADGFKTQALFQSELYVTRGVRNDTLFVLDRWNCLLREVVVSGAPGGYLTRVYTVHGLTDKLVIPGLREPKCYGDGSLASPRRVWFLRDSWVAFAVDGGLYQFDTATRELLLMGKESVREFQTEELRSVSAPDAFTLMLQFWDGSKSTVRARQERCPPDLTSLAGGDCTTPCVLNQGRFVDQDTGVCTACILLACGLGQEFVPCSRTKQGFCRDCPNTDPGVFIKAGSCEGIYKQPAPPCLPGHYLEPSGRYCLGCPPLSTTRFSGATRVEQCKCMQGLTRSGASCIGVDLYVYSEWECVDSPGLCEIPTNATLVYGGTGLGRCIWECDVGFYESTQVPQRTKSCKPCQRGAADTGNYVTRGDAESPMSCELAFF